MTYSVLMGTLNTTNYLTHSLASLWCWESSIDFPNDDAKPAVLVYRFLHGLVPTYLSWGLLASGIGPFPLCPEFNRGGHLLGSVNSLDSALRSQFRCRWSMALEQFTSEFMPFRHKTRKIQTTVEYSTCLGLQKR